MRDREAVNWNIFGKSAALGLTGFPPIPQQKAEWMGHDGQLYERKYSVEDRHAGNGSETR
jgi:hypothetical protein